MKFVWKKIGKRARGWIVNGTRVPRYVRVREGQQVSLEVRISFQAQVVSIGRWGKHAEYDKWTW